MGRQGRSKSIVQACSANLRCPIGLIAPLSILWHELRCSSANLSSTTESCLTWGFQHARSISQLTRRRKSGIGDHTGVTEQGWSCALFAGVHAILVCSEGLLPSGSRNPFRSYVKAGQEHPRTTQSPSSLPTCTRSPGPAMRTNFAPSCFARISILGTSTILKFHGARGVCFSLIFAMV